MSTGGRTAYYNSNHTEISFVGGPERLTFKADYIHGKVAVSGVNYKITVPRGGMLLHHGGHYVLDSLTGEWKQVSGPDDFYSGDIAGLFEALTP